MSLLERRFHARPVKLRLIVVGRDRNDPLCQAADAYLARMERTFEIEVVELKEVPLRKSSSVDKVMADEAERIRKALSPRDRTIVLDKSGRSFTSEGIAERLDWAMQGGLQSLAFVIGGPSGIHPSLISEADEKWSLSKLTLPHRLARLLLSEQLYRGLSILRNEPYHK